MHFPISLSMYNMLVMWSDDIVEAYKKLRNLVMDYLGISAPTPSVSDLEPFNTDSNLLEKENTGDTITVTQATSNTCLVRTWSKPSLCESATQQALASLKAKTGSPMPPSGRGIVVGASINAAYMLLIRRL